MKALSPLKTQFHTTLALLLLTLLATAQGGPEAPDLTKWTQLDQVMIAVNTDALTMNAIHRKVAQRMSELEISTEEDFIRLRDQVVQEEVRDILEHQAGQDMGFDPARVEAITRQMYQDEIREMGGISKMGDQLTIEGQTGREKQEGITSELYVQSWKNSVTGRDAGPAGRPYVDRFVRPSRVSQIYKRMAKTGANIEFLEDLGAKPALYELQALLLSARDFTTLEKAEKRAIEARQALGLGAADWDELIDQIGAYPDRGVVGPLPLLTIQGALDPGNGALVEFVLEQVENAYTGVMPFAPPDRVTGRRTVQGFVIYRFLGFEPAVLPGFNDPGVQKILTRGIQWETDQRLIAEALIELEKKAYVWFTGIEERKQQIEEARAEEERKALEARERNAEAERAKKGEKPQEDGAVEEKSGPPEPPGGGS